MTISREMQDTVARAICTNDPDEPCEMCAADALDAIAALTLAGYLKTDDGAGASPAASAAPLDPAAQAGETIGSPAPSSPQPEPDHACILVDKDGDIWRYEDNDGGDWWICETESGYGRWEFVCPLYGPFRVYAPQTDGAGASPRQRGRYVLTLTDDGAVPPPVEQPGVAPPAAAESAIASTAPSSPRLFELVRSRDVSGVTGTGVVADGVEWTDSTVTLRWKGDHPATAVWDSVESILAVHGHEGATVVRWLDGAE